jgi:chorismate mutase
MWPLRALDGATWEITVKRRDAGDEVAVLKAATREAHVAAQELASVIREARKLQAELKGAATIAVDEAVKPVIDAGMEKFNKSLMEAIELATEAVYKRFDIIRDLLLGEDRATVRRGEESIQDLAEYYVANRQRLEKP